MSLHLVTGYAGKEHITSADQGSFNAAVMGVGEFVLEGGEQFRCQVLSNNKVRIYDGEALMQGRHIKVERNTYEETTHDNGTQGYQRIDLVVLTYTKDATTGIENVTLDVIKGTPSASNPVVPGYVKGDILNLGDLKNQMPLYKIPFDGLSIGEPVAMFKTIKTLETMKAEVTEELEEKFNTLELSVDAKIANAGKPLSSSAADWNMIANYGEYSADAKTVGEEFSKMKSKYITSTVSLQKWIENNITIASVPNDQAYHYFNNDTTEGSYMVKAIRVGNFLCGECHPVYGVDTKNSYYFSKTIGGATTLTQLTPHRTYGTPIIEFYGLTFKFKREFNTVVVSASGQVSESPTRATWHDGGSISAYPNFLPTETKYMYFFFMDMKPILMSVSPDGHIGFFPKEQLVVNEYVVESNLYSVT